MAAPPFKVKASYDYNSPHEDDLSFSAGQIITVTEEEDADWYVGEYADASGETQSGLFPKNFVERYEPAPPPRPVRAARPKPAEKAPEQPIKEPEPESKHASASQAPVSTPAPAPVPESLPQPTSPPVIKAADPPVPKPAPAPAAARSPPPVSEKPSSFRDRIAAFNKPAAPPIAPFKPAGLGTSDFIKKPFVAPPPSRNAYVPPPARELPPQKVYRREEDPEIAERQAQDLENASKAGLVPTGEQDEAEEPPKAVSLKERIALLQKQQMEQAARRTETAKEKPKRPPKKRTESQETDEAGERGDIPTSEPIPRGSSDLDREHYESTRKPPKAPKPVEPSFSDGNDADQSAADETTEDAEGASTGIDEAEESRPRKPAAEPEHGEDEESTEEEEVDEETRHQMALRERMAKLSRGMGMPGMFGPPGGMPMMGMGASKKKRHTEKHAESIEEASPTAQAPRIPVIPMPGINRANTGDSATGPASPSAQRGGSLEEDLTEHTETEPITKGISSSLLSLNGALITDHLLEMHTPKTRSSVPHANASSTSGILCDLKLTGIIC
jgi:myosin tail region-interacting protein MTI1